MFQYGGALQLLELTPAQIDVRDIIHGLGQINRFNGQTAEPIPVLWHSLMVMQLCAAENRATRLEALFHDAGETYSGDYIRPLRNVMGERLMLLRETIQETIFEAVGLPGRSAKLSAPVHRADHLMVRCEMKSPWGYGRLPTWYERPSNAEETQVENALEYIGWPGRNTIDHDRLHTLFLDHADRLIGPEAPIRGFIAKAKHGRRRS